MKAFTALLFVIPALVAADPIVLPAGWGRVTAAPTPRPRALEFKRQDLSSIPECAIQCLGSAPQDCGGDPACICSDQATISSISACIQDVCTGDELARAATAAAAFCAEGTSSSAASSAAEAMSSISDEAEASTSSLEAEASASISSLTAQLTSITSSRAESISTALASATSSAGAALSSARVAASSSLASAQSSLRNDVSSISASAASASSSGAAMPKITGGFKGVLAGAAMAVGGMAVGL